MRAQRAAASDNSATLGYNLESTSAWILTIPEILAESARV